MIFVSQIRNQTALVALCLAVWATCAADSWNLPEEATYASDDGHWRLIVTPRELSNQLEYFEDKVAGKDKAGERPGGNDKARGLLQRRTEQGWINVWDRGLVNDVAPVEVLVSSEGRIATLDNWHAMGYGDSAVVVYDMSGLPVCSLSLYDLLPPVVVDNLPRSVSSIQWRTESRYSDDEQVLLLTIAWSGVLSLAGDRSDDAEKGFQLGLRLKDCSALPPSREVWQEVLATAEQLQSAADKEDAIWREKFQAPLSAPTDDDPRAWKSYLSLAWSRVNTGDSRQYARMKVLTSEGQPEFESSFKEVLGELQSFSRWSDILVVGSPSPKSLVAAIEQFAAGTSANMLNSKQIVLALPTTDFEVAREALLPTGATVVQIDPTVPLAQSNENLKRLAQRDLERAKEVAAREQRQSWWQSY